MTKPTVPGRPTPPPASHLHLWSLPDGTGLHAPYAELAVEEGTLRLCCHLCGRWFVSLGSHVRAHAHTAESYRAAMGLCRSTPLTSAPLSGSIAERQAQGYRRDAELRASLEQGRRTRRRDRPAAAQRSAGEEPAQRVHRRRAALAVGRATIAARREEELARRLTQWGHPTLHDFLRSAYSEGASLESLARRTGLGRSRLRQVMEAAGCAVRPAGSNSAEARRARAVANDAAAAARVGTHDIRVWLAERHAKGWSLSRLAAAVGHSTPWVAQRLPSPHEIPAVAT